MVSRAESEGAVWAIGMMSGTSCDGIDAALIHTDGTSIDDFGPTFELSYDVAFRARDLLAALAAPAPHRAAARDSPLLLTHLDFPA